MHQQPEDVDAGLPAIRIHGHAGSPEEQRSQLGGGNRPGGPSGPLAVACQQYKAFRTFQPVQYDVPRSSPQLSLVCPSAQVPAS